MTAGLLVLAILLALIVLTMLLIVTGITEGISDVLNAVATHRHAQAQGVLRHAGLLPEGE